MNANLKSIDVETIRKRWENRAWPNIAYFVHGQALMDIDDLLKEIDRLKKEQMQ